jgi:hypothetical protein
VYINANENRKESFFKLQRSNLVKKQKIQEVFILSIKKQKRIKWAHSLKLFQDVVFEWDFTCHMLIRAHDLRSEIIQFCVEWNVDYLLLKNEEWSQNRIFHRIVKVILFFYQDIENDAYDHDQYRLQNLQSFVRTSEKSKSSTCAKTCDVKKKFDRCSHDD